MTTDYVHPDDLDALLRCWPSHNSDSLADPQDTLTRNLLRAMQGVYVTKVSGGWVLTLRGVELVK